MIKCHKQNIDSQGLVDFPTSQEELYQFYRIGNLQE